MNVCSTCGQIGVIWFLIQRQNIVAVEGVVVGRYSQAIESKREDDIINFQILEIKVSVIVGN